MTFAPLLLRLLGVFGWLKRLVGSVANLAKRYPWQAALVVALLFGAYTRRQLSKSRADHAVATKGWTDEIAGRDKDREIVKAAQADAQRKQAIVDSNVHKTQLVLNEKVKQANETTDKARRDAVAHYVNSHRLPTKALSPVDRAASGADIASLPDNTGQPVDAGDTTAMVAITRADLDTLTTASMQAAKQERYLQALILEGLAVVEGDAQ